MIAAAKALIRIFSVISGNPSNIVARMLPKENKAGFTAISRS